ncbi:MAG: hypothetical protein PHC66_00235 [Candidatus Nanoarchaeia archaeon]|nr:hypothetical protein [Candidatus Nanoarchaeia archaeon]MDD5239623.1 hypothetical protein [Candidatus Nanoarchaeia archaeon]
MDTQDIALMLVIGILVIALIVVNTAPVGQIEESVSIDKPLPARIPLRSSVTTMVSVYDPTIHATTRVEVI